MTSPQELYNQGVAIREDPAQFNYGGTVELRDRFQKAIEEAEKLGKSYAHAYAERSYSYVREFQQGLNPNPDALLQLAETDANTAISFADDFDAHWSLAIVLWNKGNFSQSLDEYAVAESMFDASRPDLSADMVADRGEALIYAGRSGDAIAEIERAIAMRKAMVPEAPIPYWYLWNYARALFMLEKYPEAIAKIGEMEKPPPNDVLLITAASKAQFGDPVGAKADMDLFSENDPDWSIAIANVRRFELDADRQRWTTRFEQLD